MTPLYFTAAFVAGLCLGTVYFAVLWTSVRRLTAGASVRSHIALTLARLALILGAVAGALALELPLSQLAFAGLGFVAARLAATRLMRPHRKEP